MIDLPKSYDQWRTASEPSYPKMRYEFLCEDCDSPVYSGDTYYEVDGFYYCNKCIRNYRTSTEKDELCEICEEVIPYDELATWIHGVWICERCIDWECKQEAR